MENQNQLASLHQELIVVQAAIKRLENTKDITDRVSASFHLGMVGGSGRNTQKLNKKREAALDKTIERAKILTKLYGQERALQFQIKDIEEDGPEKREAIKQRVTKAKVEYWKGLKAGDKVALLTGNEITIVKKNKKSIISENCTWKASEIIGKEAAQLL